MEFILALRMIINRNAKMEPRLEYDVFGLPKGDDLNSDITDQGFTGHQHLDNFGLIHMGGRIYDPKIGRFLSPDIIISQDLTNPQTLNPYSYCLNNPLKFIDPTGYEIKNSGDLSQSIDHLYGQQIEYQQKVAVAQEQVSIFAPFYYDVLSYLPAVITAGVGVVFGWKAVAPSTTSSFKIYEHIPNKAKNKPVFTLLDNTYKHSKATSPYKELSLGLKRWLIKLEQGTSQNGTKLFIYEEGGQVLGAVQVSIGKNWPQNPVKSSFYNAQGQISTQIEPGTALPTLVVKNILSLGKLEEKQGIGRELMNYAFELSKNDSLTQGRVMLYTKYSETADFFTKVRPEYIFKKEGSYIFYQVPLK